MLDTIYEGRIGLTAFQLRALFVVVVAAEDAAIAVLLSKGNLWMNQSFALRKINARVVLELHLVENTILVRNGRT